MAMAMAMAMAMTMSRMVALTPDFVLGPANPATAINSPVRLQTPKIENFPNHSVFIQNRSLQFPLARSNYCAGKGRLQLSAASSNLSTDSHITSAPPPPPPVEGLIGLSVADLRGTTVAVDTLYSGDSVKVTSVPSGEFPLPMWTTIGHNLIAYGVGDQANLQFYFNLLTNKFSRLDLLAFMDIVLFNRYNLFHVEWTHCGGFTIHVRDRTKVQNLLEIKFGPNFYFSQYLMEKTSTSIGTGGPSAEKVLNNFNNIISCNEFSTNEKLREHIVSKAIVEAMVKNKYYNKFLKANTCFKGYAEVLWGSPTECWKVVSRTSMDQLLNMYDSRVLRAKNRDILPYHMIANEPDALQGLDRPMSDDSIKSQAALIKELKRLYRPPTNNKINTIDTGPYTLY